MLWNPTASPKNIKERADLLRQIRQFFYDRNILEVETPLLSQSTIPDPHIHSLTTKLFDKTYYLQTSPEFHMKRLLAYELGALGSIYQICKAFRDDEAGSQHNPEFTMLEWYRVGYDLKQFMQEMDEFLQTILQTKSAIKLSYQAVFLKYLDVDPLAISANELQQLVKEKNIEVIGLEDADKDTWLHLLMSHVIEPQLKHEYKATSQLQPVFIYDFPISQAALAKTDPENPLVAERFEVYCEGLELANGFHELTDAAEQRKRFMDDNEKRKALGIEEIPLDENFLQALEQGLPDCSGVALGIDRLLMLKLKAESIAEVINFPVDRA